MKRIFFLGELLIILLFSSCLNETEENAKFNLSIAKSTELLDFQKLVSSTNIIQLENNDSLFLSDIDDVLMQNEKIYILDKMQEAIMMYDSTGRYLKRYQEKGRAKNEYTNLDDWTFDENGIYLLDFNKVIILDNELNYRRTIYLTKIVNDNKFIGADRIELYKGRLFVYDDNNKSVYSITKDGSRFIRHILTDQRKCSLNIGLNPNEKVFHPIGDALYVVPGRSDCIYKLYNEDVELFATIDYENKEKNYAILNSTKGEDYNSKVSHIPYSIHQIFTSGNNIYMFYPARGGSYIKINLKDSTYHEYVGYKEGMVMKKDHPSWDAINGNMWYRLVEKNHEEMLETPSSIVNNISAGNIHKCDSEVLQYLVIYSL